MDDERTSKEGFGEADDIAPVTPRPRADRITDEEVEKASEEAGEIGGHTPSESLPSAEQAPTESGGGQAEGFELAEQQLQESASHGDTSGRHPLGDRFPEEEEDPREHTIHGEADRADSSETHEDNN